MKNIILYLFFILINTTIYAQFSEGQILINVNGPEFALTGDIDGDTTLELIFATHTGTDEFKIYWCNINEDQTCGELNLIDAFSYIHGNINLKVIDIDNDNDLDIVITLFNTSIFEVNGEILWYENEDGNGSFGPQQFIDSISNNGTLSIEFEDIDSDGLKDILVYGNKQGGCGMVGTSHSYFVKWYKNNNTNGFNSNWVSGHDFFSISSHFADFNNDGKIDILVSRDGFDSCINPVSNLKLFWYNNSDGVGNFTTSEEYYVSTSQTGTKTKNIDLDNDGDQDIIASVANNLIWYENTDGLGHFSEAVSLANTNIGSYKTVDINNDGYVDILSSNVYNNNIKLYLNLGSANLSQILIPTLSGFYPSKISTCKINNDANTDILTVSQSNNAIVWYENLNTLPITASLNQYNSRNFSVFPNPTNGILNINFSVDVSHIKIYNTFGKLVISNFNNKSINISNLNQGIYFAEIKDNIGNFKVRKIIKID